MQLLARARAICVFPGAGPPTSAPWHRWGIRTPAVEILDHRLVDRCALELEVIKVLGKRQFCDGKLIPDRASLLLVDLGVEQIADNALGVVLALDSGRHDLVEGRLHAVEL